MFRALLYAILGIFIITVIRMFAGVISKGVGELFQEQSRGTTPPPTASAGGPLKRDPVCGAYVPADASVRKVIDGETLHFCSPDCRDKYPA